MAQSTSTLLTCAALAAVLADSAWGLGFEATVLPGRVRWEYLSDDGSAVGIDRTSGASVSRDLKGAMSILLPPSGRKWTAILSHHSGGWLLAESVERTDTPGGRSAQAYAGQLTMPLQRVSGVAPAIGNPPPATALAATPCAQDCGNTLGGTRYGGRLWREVVAIGGDGTIAGVASAEAASAADVPQSGKAAALRTFRMTTDGAVEFSAIESARPQRIGPARDVLLGPGPDLPPPRTLSVWHADGTTTKVELPATSCQPAGTATPEGWLMADGGVAGNALVHAPVGAARTRGDADCVMQPFVWHAQAPAQLLSSLPSYAYPLVKAVNDFAVMVGFAAKLSAAQKTLPNGTVVPDGDSRAVLWAPGKPPEDLNGAVLNADAIAGFVLTDAYAINAHGEILVHTRRPDGARATMLLRKPS